MSLRFLNKPVVLGTVLKSTSSFWYIVKWGKTEQNVVFQRRVYMHMPKSDLTIQLAHDREPSKKRSRYCSDSFLQL